MINVSFLRTTTLFALSLLLAQTPSTPAHTVEAHDAVRAHGPATWHTEVSAWCSESASRWNTGRLTPAFPNAEKFTQIHFDATRRARLGNGEGVTVAVIDTGVDFTHPQLRHVLDERHARDFIDGDARPEDEPGGRFSGHGTGVAGIIHQVAPGARILPLRVLAADGAGHSAKVAEAITYAVDQGAHVINLSLGSRERKEKVMAAVAYAAQRGVIIVSSVGNHGQKQADYPAADARQLALVISVGSVNGRDVKSSFSNYGETEVNTNGERVATLYPAGTTTATGTSFAAPQVSGLVALALAAGQSPERIEWALVNGAESIDDLTGNKTFAGQLGGRVNAASLAPLSMRGPAQPQAE